MKLLIRKRADLAGLAFPDDGGFVPAPRGQVPIQAVVGEVQLAADEPFRPWGVPLEDLCPWLKPFELARDPGPESLRIGVGFLVQPLVLLDGFDVGAGTELRGRSK